MAEELLINVNVQGEEQIPNLDKTLDNVNKTAGKTKDAFSQMRTEMRNAKADMLSAAEGSDKYNEAMKRAAASADKMRDMNDKIKASQRDVGVVAKNVTGMVSGLAGAFSTAQGIIGLFGVESDNVTKAILKVTQVMQVTSGIAQIADSFDSMKDIFLAVKLRIAEMVAVKTTDTAVTNVNTGAQVANAAAVKGVGVAATTSAKAVMKALGPYALIAAAIGAIIYGVSKLIDKINEVPEEVKLNIEIDKTVSNKLNDTYTKSMQFAYDYNKAVKDGNQERINGLAKVGKEEFGLHQTQLDMIADNVTNWRKAFSDYIKLARETYKLEALIKNEAEATIKKEDIDKTSELNKKEIADLKTKLKEAGVSESEITQAETGSISGFLGAIGKNYNDLKKLKNLNVEYQQNYLDWLKAVSTLSTAKIATSTQQLKMNDLNLGTLPGKTSGAGKEKPSTIEAYKEKVKADITEASPEVQRATVELETLKTIDKEIANEKKAHNDRIDLINSRAKMGNLEYINSLIKEQEAIIDSNNKKVKNRELTYNSLKIAYDAQLDLHNKNVDDTNKAYNSELNKLNVFNSEKARIQNELNAANDSFGKATNDKERQRIKNTIINLTEEKDANERSIKTSTKKLGTLDEQKKGLTTKGGDIISEYNEKLKGVKDSIIEANGEIADSTEQLANLNREKWQEMSADAMKYLDALGGLTDGLSQFYQAQQKQVDSQTEGFKKVANGSKMTKKEEEKLRKTDIKTYNAAVKAKNGSDADRAKFTKDLELAAWEVKAKLFEKQKAAEKASVLMNTASGIISIWSRSYGELGPIAGPILAAVETAGLVATAFAQIKTINAQKLDAPSESISSPSSSGAATFAALTPSQTTMTTSQENLNMMNASNKVQAVVKVSEINEVQNIVRVRENNSSY